MRKCSVAVAVLLLASACGGAAERDYDSTVRNAFLENCQYEGGDPSTCAANLECIEEQLTQEEFEYEQNWVLLRSELSDRMTDVLATCMSGSSASDHQTRSNGEASSAPLLGDHWHSIYDIYVCTDPAAGTWRQEIVVERDPDGIHTHGDGLIHIHPFNSKTTGDGATLGSFFDAFGGYISDSAIKLDTGEVIEEGFDCGGQPAVLTVARFDVGDRGQNRQVYAEGLSNIRFLKDLEAFTIAFIPADETPPRPRPERFTFLETVDPRALISDSPVLEIP